MSSNNTPADNDATGVNGINGDTVDTDAQTMSATGEPTGEDFFGEDPTENLIVAIDGPAGTGKSTVSRRVAAAMGAQYLDTGAMYRVATLQVLREGIDPADTDAVIAATANIPLEISDDPEATEVLLDGKDVSAEIRSNDVTAHVSAVSAISEVRRNLVELQRTLGRNAGRCVVEGRDIGTVVFPDANVKVYLTASAEVRAERRHQQNLEKGIESEFEQVLADVNLRDEKDSSRADSPLRPADDATQVDTSEMDIDEVLTTILDLVEEAEDALYDAAEAKVDADDTDDADDADVADSAGDLGPLVFRTSDGQIVDPDAAAEQESAAVQDMFDDSDFGPADFGDDDSADSDHDAEPSIDPEALDDGDFLTIDDDTDWAAVEEAFGVVDGQDLTKEALCTVAIIGRPNVGKSTLVNRFIGRREAVVEDFPGVTRDRISYMGDWGGKRFWVQDTGGWDPDAKGIHRAIARQAETAMETADVIVFVVDVKVGVTSVDEIIARRLQRSDIPVIVVGNKFDSDNQYGDLADLWSLGLGNPFPVSAQHGRGAADVLDEVLAAFPEHPRAESVTGGPRRVALVGKPNVGKSSLLNKISGEDRAVVDNVAGTTVDPVDSLVELNERTWTFVDTAGIRKKTKTAVGHEFYASLRTRSAIDAAEVVVLLLDASEPITEQDQRVLRLVLDSGRALVVAYNKWDQVDEDRRDLLEREIDLQLAHIPWARRVNISAKTGRALQKLEPAMIEALDSWDRRIPTGQLNTWLRAIIAATPPPMRSGRLPKVLFATQASTRPPVIVLFTSAFLEHGYRRFLERKLRESFNFDGSPVRIAVRVRERRQRK